MSVDYVNFDQLFSADEYYRAGCVPWTFFAYPASLASKSGLPPDTKACRLLGAIQDHGIDVALWSNGPAANTTYFACRKEDRPRLHGVLDDLIMQGLIDRDYLARRSEELFAQLVPCRETRLPCDHRQGPPDSHRDPSQ